MHKKFYRISIGVFLLILSLTACSKNVTQKNGGFKIKLVEGWVQEDTATTEMLEQKFYSEYPPQFLYVYKNQTHGKLLVGVYVKEKNNSEHYRDTDNAGAQSKKIGSYEWLQYPELLEGSLSEKKFILDTKYYYYRVFLLADKNHNTFNKVYEEEITMLKSFALLSIWKTILKWALIILGAFIGLGVISAIAD